MKRRIGAESFRIIEAWLRREAMRLRGSQPLTAVGLVQAACMDGTDLPARSSRDPHDTRKGLGDPEARVGRGKRGFILGYQSLFLVDIKGFPLGHVVNGPQGKFTVADGVATNAHETLELTKSLGLPALFVVSDLNLPVEMEEGVEITIFVNVSNVGEVKGAYEVNLSVDGEVVYSENVTLAGGGFLLGISQEK